MPNGAEIKYKPIHYASLPLGATSYIRTGAIATSPASPTPLSIRAINSIQKAYEIPPSKLDSVKIDNPEIISHIG